MQHAILPGYWGVVHASSLTCVLNRVCASFLVFFVPQEIVQSYNASGAEGHEESEFRDLVRPLMAVLKTGTLKARQAAANALARLAEDQVRRGRVDVPP